MSLVIWSAQRSGGRPLGRGYDEGGVEIGHTNSFKNVPKGVAVQRVKCSSEVGVGSVPAVRWISNEKPEQQIGISWGRIENRTMPMQYHTCTYIQSKSQSN